MSRQRRGFAHCIDGVLDVDWDISIAEDNRFLLYAADQNISDEECNRHLARNCFVNMDPEIRKRIIPGDFLVGNRGVGWGHGHDQAILALQAVGFAAVICETTTTTFKRNCLNHGLPIIEIHGIFNRISDGDQLELVLDVGCMKNLSTKDVFHFAPYPDFILEILDAGGLYSHLKMELPAMESKHGAA
jgi:3-isopropylmalate/(R)-2-methylmalate dehydratase small subunit